MKSSDIFRLKIGPTCRSVNKKYASYWSCVKINRIIQDSATRGPQLLVACEILINAEQNGKVKNMEISSISYFLLRKKTGRLWLTIL